MSSSESEEEQFESIIATRQRRSNAGSRLKHLLQLEADEQESLNDRFQTEDDENVNLLFQEDGEDEEFVESESEDGDEGEAEDEDEDENNEESNTKKRKRETTAGSDNEEDNEDKNNDLDDDSDVEMANVDSDEMLSNSDLSDSDSDESEGERELQKEQMMKKRKEAKFKAPPVIIKPKKSKDTSTTNKNPAQKKKQKVYSDLLTTERRSSTRKTTIQNTIETHQKLTEQKERQLKVQPKQKIEYVEKTLEERLEEAKITEQQNTLSLQLFFEQEIEKKKKQRDMFNNKKFKMIEFLTFRTTGIYVTPLDEVKEIAREKRLEEEELAKKAKKRRYGRRKKEATPQPQTSEIDNPETSVKMEGEFNQHENVNGTETETVPKPEENTQQPTPKSETDTANSGSISDVTNDQQNGDLKTQVKVEQREESKVAVERDILTDIPMDVVTEEATLDNDGDSKMDAVTTESTEAVSDSVIPDGHDEGLEAFTTAKEVKEEGTEKEVTEEAKEDAKEEGDEEIKEEEGKVMKEESKQASLESKQSDPSQQKTESLPENIVVSETAEDVKLESSNEHDTSTIKEEKTVTFADEKDVEISTETDAIKERSVSANESTFESNGLDAIKPDQTPDTNGNEEIVEEEKEEEEPKEIEPTYEGPPQFVAANYVSFEQFKRDLSPVEVKSILLGEQSILPGPRRDPHVENICVIKRDFQKDINLKKLMKQREKNFQTLLKLPKFGEKYQQIEDLAVEKPKEEVKITISTPAPVGIHLPNGTKKKCLINGDFSVYYDPSNGIPYGSVEGFKVLKKLAEGGYYWNQIDNGGVNSVFKGGIGCYFGEVDAKHAKGVPEGF